jgi:hypothetical protein
MKNTKLIIIILFFVAICGRASAQTVAITDKEPANLGGLSMGYIIKSTEVKAVSTKGDFSRYAIKFYVTNTSPETKIILYKQGWNVLGNVSDRLVQFNCLNATGARFTSKQADISAPACNVLALVDDKDITSNKTVQNKRLVQIGYWIKAGQTISADAIMICPLNELPKMEATYLANQLQPVASAVFVGGGNGEVVYHNDVPLQPGDGQNFVKVRNLLSRTYLNCESGQVQSSIIDDGWWSAQWLLIPIPGTRYFNIKSRWKETYVTTDSGKLSLFSNYMSDGARWILEPASVPQSFRILNVDNHQYLCVGSNELKMTLNGTIPSTTWALERPQ